MKEEAVINAWSLREVYFDEDGNPSMHRSPRQRTWVGLTIEDKKEYIAQDFGGSRTDAMDWTEKRLMEKNNGNHEQDT